MLTIGSRGSQLALWQARWVQTQIEALGEATRLVLIKTTGDRITGVPLAKVGAKGLFTKEIEEALLDRRIDVAVHSLKDMPTELPAGLALAAIPEREDPRDAMVGARLAELPDDARIGTSSLRRTAQLLAIRPGLRIESIRGNIDTRLKKVEQGFDAVVLAAAGLRRLGWDDRITETLPPELMCPAAGQGALAIETRDDGGAGQAVCRRLDHPATRVCVTAERALLASLGGGCQVPIGALGLVEGDRLKLTAVVVSPDGRNLIRRQAGGRAADAESLGAGLGHQLLAAGGREILTAVYGERGNR